MDARILLTMAVVLTAWRYTSAEKGVVEASTSTASPSESVTVCLTARNVSGICVQRNSCDYSTGAIDFTLFAPHAYKRPCAMAEVCCPQAAIVHVEPSKSDASDFDDDDDM